MAISSINPFKATPKKSTLEKIADVVGIVQGVVGTAIAVPKALKGMELAERGQTLEEGTKLRPAKEGEEGAFDAPKGSLFEGQKVVARDVSGGEVKGLIQNLRLQQLMTQNRPLTGIETQVFSTVTGQPEAVFSGKNANDPIIGRLVLAAQAKERVVETGRGRDVRTRALDEQIARNKRSFIENTAVKFEGDATVKKATEARESAKRIITLVDFAVDNPIAAGSIPTFMARASGEVGNLSEADKKPFGGSRAITARIAQAFKTWRAGTITESNKGFIKELAELMVNHGNNVRRSRANEFAAQRAAVRKDMDKDDILEILGFGRTDDLTSDDADGF